MNANEVIAHLAADRMGAAVHPNDDVNMSQSSNDVFPSAVHLAAAVAIARRPHPGRAAPREALRKKQREFDARGEERPHALDGRDAGHARSGVRWLRVAGRGRHRPAPGHAAAAVRAPARRYRGRHGINAPKGFARKVIKRLAERTGLPLTEAKDHFAAQGARDALVEMSGQCETLAVSLIKIANDLRWMGSGPRTGLAEIRLPDLQPGSSIMPGKVNPVIPEVVTQVGAQVIGNDAAVDVRGFAGQLRAQRVRAGDRAQPARVDRAARAACAGCSPTSASSASRPTSTRCRRYAESSPSIGTALNPHLGYEKAARDHQGVEPYRQVDPRDRARPQAHDRRGARPRARRRVDDPRRHRRVRSRSGNGRRQRSDRRGATRVDPDAAIVAAFFANLGIAVLKFAAFLFTGSSSMLSESIHSLADTGNQGLLLLGRRRSRPPGRRATPVRLRPVRYFYAFIVAFVLFSLGGIFSIFEGIEKLRSPHSVDALGWAVGVLLGAIVLESFSLRTAMHEANLVRPEHEGWWRFIRRTKSPDLPVVLLEDTARARRIGDRARRRRRSPASPATRAGTGSAAWRSASCSSSSRSCS